MLKVGKSSAIRQKASIGVRVHETAWPSAAFSCSPQTLVVLLFAPGDNTVARQRKDKEEEGIKLICRNRRAFHDYIISDRLECGIVLTGTEVKSLREGSASLEDAYAKAENGEVWLLGSDIPEYSMAHRMNHKPKRPRKLLLHRREIAKFAGKASQRGLTLVPLRMYFKEGRAKIELAVAKGKQAHDKRQSMKEADAQRDIRRAISERKR